MTILHPLRALFATVLVLLAIATPATALDIREVKTPKGITIWLVEDHAIPLIVMDFRFFGGESHEPEDKQGLATFLSVMLDEGAGDMPSQVFQRRVEELAMKLSFSSSLDYFSGSFKTLTRNREASFALLKLALTRPRFDADAVERMRRQLIATLKRKRQQPDHIAFQAFKKALFGDHPYARSGYGALASLRAITAGDLRDLHRRLFARNKLLVTMAGDIDAATAARLVDATFGELPAKSGIREIDKPVFPQRPVTRIIKRPIPQTLIFMGHEAPVRADPDFIAAELVRYILGGGNLSRLNTELREKRGLTYSTYAALHALRKTGVFLAHASTVNGKAGETLKLMRQTLARLAEEGPTEKELREAKTYIINSYYLGFGSLSGIASNLLGIRGYNLGIDYLKRRKRLIEAVTIEDTRRVARRLIRLEKMITILTGQPQGVAAPQR